MLTNYPSATLPQPPEPRICPTLQTLRQPDSSPPNGRLVQKMEANAEMTRVNDKRGGGGEETYTKPFFS